MTKRLQMCGYNKKIRYEVVLSALQAYTNIEEAEHNGERPMYRPRMWHRVERREANKEKRRYKRSNYDSVLFIPCTPNSQLKHLYQDVIKKSSLKIDVVEKAGRNLKSLLQKSDPFAETKCKRDNCFVCSTGGKGPCSTEGVTYDLECENGCPVKGIYRVKHRITLTQEG